MKRFLKFLTCTCYECRFKRLQLKITLFLLPLAIAAGWIIWQCLREIFLLD